MQQFNYILKVYFYTIILSLMMLLVMGKVHGQYYRNAHNTTYTQSITDNFERGFNFTTKLSCPTAYLYNVTYGSLQGATYSIIYNASSTSKLQLNNCTLSGGSCTHNFLVYNNTRYFIAPYKDGNTFAQDYQSSVTPALPLIDSRLIWGDAGYFHGSTHLWESGGNTFRWGPIVIYIFENCTTANPTLTINTDLINQTYYVNSSLVNYNFTYSNPTNMTLLCKFFENGAIFESITITNYTINYQLNHSVATSGDYLLYMNCYNSEVNKTTNIYRHTYIFSTPSSGTCDISSLENKFDLLTEMIDLIPYVLLIILFALLGVLVNFLFWSVGGVIFLYLAATIVFSGTFATDFPKFILFMLLGILMIVGGLVMFLAKLNQGKRNPEKEFYENY